MPMYLGAPGKGSATLVSASLGVRMTPYATPLTLIPVTAAVGSIASRQCAGHASSVTPALTTATWNVVSTL